MQSIHSLILTLSALSGSTANTPAEAPQLAWGDFDADGRADLLVLQAGAAPRLLRNLGDGGFADATAAGGLADLDPAHAASWRDVDDDGDLDLLLLAASGPSLWLNAAGSFVDAGAGAGLGDLGFVREAVWLDFDGDGREDLQLATAAGPALLHNLGAARFAPVDLDLGLADEAAPGALTLTAEPAPEQPAPARRADETRTQEAAVGGFGSAASGARAAASASGLCAATIMDMALGGCLSASSLPTLGQLMPLSIDFNVSAAGFVGMGTTAPASKLHVVGDVRASGQLISTVVSGAPLQVSSNNLVPLLNADLLDGMHASSFSQFGTAIESSEVADGTLVDADVAASAAIAGTKIAPDFGSQPIRTTGTLGVGASAPQATGHFSNLSLGLGASVKDSEDLIVESADAFLGLFANGSGQFGSGITLKQVDAGVLADSWAILRESQASGADLRFTYGTNKAPYLNSARMTLLSSGDLGLGTGAPETRLHIVGGSDAGVGGGGNIQMGASSGQNIALDENEIMARDNGVASKLFLNNDGGHVLVNASGSGNLGVGTSTPTGRLHVVHSGGGNGSVVLPDNSIGLDELENEPGLASAVNTGWLPLAKTPKTGTSRTISVPTDGYVIALASVYTECVGAGAVFTWDIMTTPGDPSNGYSDHLFGIGGSTIGFQKIFPVTKGANSFYLRGKFSVAGGIIQSRNHRLTLLFVPTAYGTIQY